MAEWTASLEVSHAPISASQDGKQDLTETPAGSISSTRESFAKFSHDGCLLKTSRQFSLFQQEEPYLENLPRSGSMRSGELFERPMLAPRIDGTGRSFWPTSRTQDAKHGECTDYELSRDSGKDLLHVAVERLNWHTPRANECEEGAETFVKRNGDRGDHCFSGLSNQIANWPTPDANESSYSNGKFGENLREKAANWPTPRSEDSESCGNHPGAVDSLTGATRQWATPWTITGGGESAERKKELGRDESGGGDLQSQVTDWPTPKALDWKSAEGQQGLERNDPDLNVIACRSFPPAPETPPHGSESLPNAPTSRRRLNPNFVEWLMSLPPGWTDYAPVETASWFSRVRMRLECLLNARG
jgi:hypothetical protein